MEKDIIKPKWIKSNVKVNSEIVFYDTTDSTNTRLKELAKQGAKEGTVVIAEYQTAGRGRLGRSFYSPTHSGIYMSLLIRPNEKTDVGMITAYTSVAVCNALDTVNRIYYKEVYKKEIADSIDKNNFQNITNKTLKNCEIAENGKNDKHDKIPENVSETTFDVPLYNNIKNSTENVFGIKWVNDIIKNNKKVCGILAESGIEENDTRYIIVGIGINVYPPDNGFPEDIENIAESIFPQHYENIRNRIISEVINNFYSYSADFVAEYRKRSTVIGKNINVHKGTEIKKAFAVDIDDRCNLIVRYENGDLDCLSFGEVSVRTV